MTLNRSTARHFLFPHFFYAVLIVPMQPSPDWTEVSYSKSPPNRVEFSRKGLEIGVANSGSPLFYNFRKNHTITGLHVSGALSGLPNLAGELEGIQGGDDFALRVGIVESGNEKANWFERFFAPEWLKKLIEIFPNQAFSRVSFINIAQQMPLGTERVHPSNKFAVEKVGLVQVKPGPFKFDYSFHPPVTGFALWLHADGDDSHSSFNVRLNDLTLDVINEVNG